MEDQREKCEAFLKREGEVCKCVNREVFPYWRQGDFRSPVKGEVYRGVASREVPGPILSPELVEGGEGWRESGGGGVAGRGGPGYPEGGQPPSVPAVGTDRGEARPEIPCFFFSCFSFSLFFILALFRLLGTKSAYSASYGRKNPRITDQPAPGKEPSTHIPLVWNQPHTSHAK